MKKLFNITFNVEDDVRDEWLRYMEEEFVPKMTRSGLLRDALLTELMLNEPQGTSYALQFVSDSPESLRQFFDRELDSILSDHRQKFGDRVVFFPTTMKIIRRF